jgi:hypothetical protein
MKDGLEIEKRYLLSRLPDFDNWDDIMNINQYYGPNGRFRKIIYDVNSIEYYRTIKTHISTGVCYEVESKITKMEFENERNFCNKKISKIRRIKNIDKVILPNKIKDVLIGDITGVKEYSNFFMAK